MPVVALWVPPTPTTLVVYPAGDGSSEEGRRARAAFALCDDRPEPALLGPFEGLRHGPGDRVTPSGVERRPRPVCTWPLAFFGPRRATLAIPRRPPALGGRLLPQASVAASEAAVADTALVDAVTVGLRYGSWTHYMSRA